MRVIHKQNEGINATRYYGVHIARGEWIAFCDDDDTMTSDALESLYRLHEGTDIVVGFATLPSECISTETTLEDFRRAQISGQGLPPTPWAKLYRRILLTEEVFDFPRNIDGAEDMIMNIRLIFKTQLKPHMLYKRIYHFRRNTASVSHVTKASIKREEAFYQALYNSIPTKEHSFYERQITYLKLNGLFPIAYSDSKSLAEKNYPYLAQLREDVIHCHYPLKFKERIVLYSRCRLLLKLTGFVELLHRFLKYHVSNLKK